METRDTEAKAPPAANCLCLCFPMGLYTAGTSKLPLLGQIEPATCFYTVLLEHSHAHRRPANESVCVLFMAAFSAPQTGEERTGRGERETLHGQEASNIYSLAHYRNSFLTLAFRANPEPVLLSRQRWDGDLCREGC